MTILGIETATHVCAAAVVTDGRVVDEQLLDQSNIHAEKLLTLIDKALTVSGSTLNELDAIAVSIGPGSFTGLRIGLSVAKGLAYATGKALVAVPTLEALALKISLGGIARDIPLILAALDARRDEVYCQLFLRTENGVEAVWDGRDMSVGKMLEALGDEAAVIVGDARAKVEQAMDHSTRAFHFPSAEVARCSAGSVAMLGHRLLLSGVTADAATLEPRYIKEFFLNTYKS